jgi:hemoglobin-like flavoprotein
MIEISNKTWVQKVDEVMASYNRIEDRVGLARQFYVYLFKLKPNVKDYFRNTDFEHQEKLILRGLQFLMDFIDGKNEFARQQVLRLSQTHSLYGLKVHPHHYFYWTEALILTVKDFDPYWVDSLEGAWREVIHFPVSFMMSQYSNKPSE